MNKRMENNFEHTNQKVWTGRRMFVLTYRPDSQSIIQVVRRRESNSHSFATPLKTACYQFTTSAVNLVLKHNPD